MAKLSTLKFASRAEQGAAFVVMNPIAPEEPLRGADGAPTTISMYGMDSAIAKRFEFEARAARQAQLQQAEDAPPTAEDLAANWAKTIDKLVALTFAWTGFEDDEGAPLACTPEHVRALYEQNEPIAYQALAFYYDRPSFFGASATPSAPSPTTASV